MAQAIRAILLASAMAASLVGRAMLGAMDPGVTDVTAPNRYQKSHMALARSPEPGDESRRNHIVSAIEDRNELCTDCVIRNGYSRYRCPTVSTLVRTHPPPYAPVYWTFVGHRLRGPTH